MSDLDASSEDRTNEPFLNTWGLIAWYAASSCLVSFVLFHMTSDPHIAPRLPGLEGSPQLANFVAILFGLVGGLVGAFGALVGNILRLFAMPAFVVTDGTMMSLIWSKLFWRIGPQCIGLAIGTYGGILTGAFLMKYFFGA